MSHDIVLRDNGVDVHDISFGLSPPDPNTVRVIELRNPVNLRPGYVIATTYAFVSVDLAPFDASASGVTLTEQGYYEVFVSNSDELAVLQPICIVDPDEIVVGASPPDANPPKAFRRLADLLPEVYPHGRVTPHASGRPYGLFVQSNRAVALEIRARDAEGSYEAIGSALVKRPGTWRSDDFALPRGASDLRLAVVFADQNLVIS